MPNVGHTWTKEETQAFVTEYKKKPRCETKQAFSIRVGKMLNVSPNGVRAILNRMEAEGTLPPSGAIQESTYPIYDEPLEMHGDALVLGDVEFPFHHAEFLNACLELTARWDIHQLILAGDVLHFDSLSTFDPNFKKETNGGLSEDDELDIRRTIAKLKPNNPVRQEMEAKLEKIGRREESDGASTELEVARKNLHRLADAFDAIDFVIGNHEGRYLRALQSPLMPSEILRQLEANQSKWRIAPFYYSILKSAGATYRITHPKNSSKGASRNLAAKFHQHILMAHNHHWLVTSDRSGEYLAAEIGCCVDETRLPYAAQRDNGGDAHVLGAAIVRNGKAWFLNKFTDWDVFLKL